MGEIRECSIKSIACSESIKFYSISCTIVPMEKGEMVFDTKTNPPNS